MIKAKAKSGKEVHSDFIEVKIKRPNDKSFTCYFPSLKDVKNFQDMMKTIITNAKREALKPSKCEDNTK